MRSAPPLRDLAAAAAGGFIGTVRARPAVPPPAPLPVEEPTPKAPRLPAWPHPRTGASRLLCAAAELDADTRPVRLEELAVRAWSRWPRTFGLKGYLLEHPDKQLVVSLLSGAKGRNLVARGFLERVAPSTYRLTPLGRAWFTDRGRKTTRPVRRTKKAAR